MRESQTGTVTGALQGFTIGVTADRRSAEQISIFEGRGAECIHGPAITTHPLRPEEEILVATQALIENPPDIVVLTTGIGVRSWFEAADAQLIGEQLRSIFAGAFVVTRGPKAKGAAVTVGLDVDWSAESATFAELIDYLSRRGVEDQKVAVQLDGNPDPVLQAELAALGAEVMPVPVYQWSTPDDLSAAQYLIQQTCVGNVDALTFTASPAVRGIEHIADQMGKLDDFKASLGDVEIFAIGPVCAEAVERAGFGKSHVPERWRLGALVMLVTTVLGEQASSLELDGLKVRLQGRVVHVAGQEPAMLTRREKKLLEVLAERPGVVHSKKVLLETVWGNTALGEHVVEVTIGRLRRRLGLAGAGIETVLRRGYRTSPV